MQSQPSAACVASDVCVFELAPTLQSMGVALREANRTLFPQSADLTVGVKLIKHGSYKIDYLLSYTQKHLPVLAMATSAAPGGVSQSAQILGDLGVIKKPAHRCCGRHRQAQGQTEEGRADRLE